MPSVVWWYAHNVARSARSSGSKTPGVTACGEPDGADPPEPADRGELFYLRTAGLPDPPGVKEIRVGDEVVRAGAGDLLVGSHEVPIITRVVEASASAPYTAVVVPIDTAALRGLHEQVGRRKRDESAAIVGRQ